MTRKSAPKPEADQTPAGVEPAAVQTPKLSKLDQLEALLRREGGASLAELETATNWQKHSIRGAIAGALKKRGLTVTSEKQDGERRYRVAATAQ
jgi:Protein of unknown function (DUF3489)/Winged helix DNA-binding domain